MTDHSKIVGLQTLLQNTCLNTHTQTRAICILSIGKIHYDARISTQDAKDYSNDHDTV